MIVRRTQVPARREQDGPDNQVEAQRLSEAGGLTQFGAHLHTLQPGWRSSSRHWHEHEDEFLLVIAGEVTVRDGDEEQVLGPGDAACWPAGHPVAHQVFNRSGAPCTYLICGTRVPRDVVHYPDVGRILTIDGPRWSLRTTAGELIEEGVEPA